VVQEPLTERGRRSRERIVDAAATVVAERGAEGASLDQILAAAGASKSQLYHYFSDKGDLVRAVIAQRFGETVDGQGTVLAELDSFDAIRRWFDMLIVENENHGCPGCALGTLASELADRDEAARADLVGCFAAWMSYLVDGLERMRARGDLIDRAGPRRLANAVFASLQGGLLLSKTSKDPQYLRDALDAAYAYLRSFRPAAGGSK
jgi:TetR/AcrR family transcriptional regulator, transcriptional repressor for nem operon